MGSLLAGFWRTQPTEEDSAQERERESGSLGSLGLLGFGGVGRSGSVQFQQPRL